jgi:hypothetical protein
MRWLGGRSDVVRSGGSASFRARLVISPYSVIEKVIDGERQV